MRKICVNTHTIVRWKERVGTDTDKKHIEQLFRNNVYEVLESARFGRLIVKVKDFIFVISRTNTKTIVHTTYGKATDYYIRDPYAEGGSYEEILRWRKHLRWSDRRRNTL